MSGGARTELTDRYDAARRLVRAFDWDGQSGRYAWDLAGRLIGMERSNSFERYYKNDAAGRLRALCLVNDMPS